MKKLILPFILAVASASAMAQSSGTPSAPCYVDGKMIATNMVVSVCQYKHGGDPMVKYSYGDRKEAKKGMEKKAIK